MKGSYNCDYCGEKFASLKELNIHKGKQHASDEAEKRRYPCTRCGKVLHSPVEVAEHMKTVHPEAVRWINIIWWAITIAALLFVIWRFLA
jgi:DNA-directed RNA polymerase subunit RPC12/RpoP